MRVVAASGLRADVRGARHPARQDFPLQREVVVVGQRRVELLVVAVGAHRGRERGVPPADPLQRDGIEVRAPRYGSENGPTGSVTLTRMLHGGLFTAPLLKPTDDVLVVEHAPAAAKTGLAIAGQVPGGAAAEAHVVIVSQGAVFGHARVSAEETFRAAHCRRASCGGPRGRRRA